MKVLTIGPLPPPIGGMAAVVANLERELGQRLDHRLLNNAKTTAEGRSLVTGVMAQLRLLGRLLGVLFRWRPSLVHIHTCSNFTFWRNGIDVLISRLFFRPVVLHIHGGRFDRFLADMGWGRGWWARRILHAAARVVVLGEDWRRRLEPWCRPGSIEVINNGVPVPDATACGVTRERVKVLCLAAYTPAKGQEDLLRAASGLSGLEIYLVGNELKAGEGERLVQLAAALDMEDRVHVTGPRSGSDKDELFDAAGIFVLPSYIEGLPMSMLEAMSWGLPVVVTRVGAIPEVVEDGVQGLLVEPGDVPGLRGALGRLLANPDEREQAGMRGRALVRDHYSLDAVGRRIVDMYRKMI